MLGEIALAIGIEVAKKVYETKAEKLSRKDTISDALARKGVGIFDRRRAERQFDHMAESVAESLVSALEVDSIKIPENEVAAALHAVKDTIQEADLDMSQLLHVDLEPSQLEEQVRRNSSKILREYSLADAALYIYNVAVRESCNYITEIATALPEIGGHAFRELLVRETAMHDLVNEILTRIPRPERGRATDPDADFELRYRRSIARKLESLQLFGVTLSESSRRVQLDVAYISLTANIVGGLPKGQSSHTAAQHALPTAGIGQRSTQTVDEDLLRIDQIQSKFNRLLIKGEAGSGKTTLLQWLAVNSARQSFVGPTELLNSAIPFFIQLRQYVNETLPRPDQFLTRMLPAISGEMPHGWVNIQLARGRALLLIDGIDELPESQRVAVAQWLEELVNEYPDCRFITTSRPSAVADDWLGGIEFQLVELQPMSLNDIQAFVDHWHDAARLTVGDPDELNSLAKYQDGLKQLVATSISIRTLAATPLLCAMLCALNRDRRTKLPRDRMELYRIALETLLDRRDIERTVASDIPELSLREKEIILQDLAFWLALNSKVDISIDLAIDRIDRKLTSLPHVAEGAHDVYRHLLIRSGLLREPIVGHVDFIHRTFQEYLAARECVEQNNIQLLVNNGSLETWREVIILACGHASAIQRAELLTGLLDQGEKHPEQKHVLHLLAVACLETSTELSPALTKRIAQSLRDLVPPNTMAEAKALSSAGELAVTSLRGYQREKVNVASACIRALSMIGSESSLQALIDYGADTRQTVIRELLRAWRNYDRDRYAELVLSRTRFRGNTLQINEPELLGAAQKLPAVEHILCDFGGRVDDLEFIRGVDKLRELSISANKKVRSLAPLNDVPRLQSLNLISCASISSYSPISTLTQLKQLTVFSHLVEDLDFLPQNNYLDMLNIFGSEIKSITGISTQPELRALTLQRLATEIDLGPLENCKVITRLSIMGGPGGNLSWIPSTRSLVTLALAEMVLDHSDKFADLVKLRALSLRSIRGREAGRAIGTLRALMNLQATDVEFEGQLEVPKTTRSVVLTDCDIADLNFLPPVCMRVTLRRCENLRDISRLSQLQNLKELNIFHCDSIVDIESTLAQLGKNVLIHVTRRRSA